MKVARQFIAWNRLEKGVPSCRDGVIFIPGCALELRAAVDRLNHTVPLGLGAFLYPSQAVNCLATII
jgi:hypothetical protein